jgi:hypothetical protein
MRRQHLDPVNGGTAVDIVQRLSGVQAQLRSAAALAVAVRQRQPDIAATTAGLTDRSLIRTWAMRGTLHLLPSDSAGNYLALLAAVRSWEKPSWQKAFLDTGQLTALTEAVQVALAGGAQLTRAELIAEVLAHSRDRSLAEHIQSGWSAVLKPLAWQGLLCQGEPRGGRVTFTQPASWTSRWSGLPDQDDAARAVVPAYLSVYGPAAPGAFDQWLTRSATPKATLRRWFADLGEDLATIDVEGTTAYVRAADLDELAEAAPTRAVRLVPAFDQYVLGPGTGDPRVVPTHRRGEVSKAAGWIAPVVIAGGKVAGTWRVDGGRIVIHLFPETTGLPADVLAAETERITPLTRAAGALTDEQ